jgi:hypothetical protein
MENRLTLDIARRLIVQAAKGYCACLEKVVEIYPNSLTGITAKELIIEYGRAIEYIQAIRVEGEK